MKNLIQTTATAIALCMTALFTQAQTTLYYSSPDTIRSCDVNRFTVSILNPVTDTIIITPQLNFPNGTAASCTTNNNGVNYIFESVTGGTASTLQTGNTLRFVLNGTGTRSIPAKGSRMYIHTSCFTPGFVVTSRCC